METNNRIHSIEGKLQPQDIDMEANVLGAIMIVAGAYERVSHILTTDSFYKENHRLIYNTIVKLRQKGAPVDIATITSQARQDGMLDQIGGPYAIAELTSKVTSDAHIEYHSRLLVQLQISRQLITAGQQITGKGYSAQAEGLEALEWAQTELQNIGAGAYRKDGKKHSKAWEDTAKELREPKTNGILTGLTDIDYKAGQLEPGTLTIIAARPGMGKTAFAMEIARNVAMADKKVKFFSVEMPTNQLLQRSIAREADIELWKLRERRLTAEEWERINSFPGYQDIDIDDTSGLTPMELEGKAATMKAKEGLDLIIVDYLQIMRGNGKHYQTREQEVSSISRDLKSIAKKLNIPVIALAQLSRETEKRTNPQPKLSDLRESGGIEQDADMIWFLYRPEYYVDDVSSDTIEVGNTGYHVPLKGHATVICEKFRQGSPFKAYIRTELSKMKFFSGPDGYGRRHIQYDRDHYPELFKEEERPAPF